jgi:hypothetical protein
MLSHRRSVQSTRVVEDRFIVSLLTGSFDAGQLQMPRGARVVDWLFGRYWDMYTTRI